MKIAIMSDIHSNYRAFKLCYERAVEEGVTEFVFLGDYLGEMAYPERTLEILYEIRKKYKCTFLRGNKEEYWLAHRKNSGEIWKAGSTTSGMLAYTYERLTEEDLDFFESMPFVKMLDYEGYPKIILCHGSPYKVNESLRIEHGYVDEVLVKVAREIDSKMILCGHFHIQTEYERQGITVINPGAVGVALYGHQTAQFMMLKGEDGVWEKEFISIPYDVEAVIGEMDEERLYEQAPGFYRMTCDLLRVGEHSIAERLRAVAAATREELGIMDYREIPEEFWDRKLTEIGI